MTIFGWDASDYDWSPARGPMDLGAARAAGLDFFTHKSTEGTSVAHARYGEALTRARDAGVPVLGSYHVVRTGNLAAELAWHLSVLDARTPWWRSWPDWLCQIDLEKWSYDPVVASLGTDFAQMLGVASGRTPVVYASRGQYGNTLGGSAPLWNANYPSGASDTFRALYARVGGDGGAGWSFYSGRTPVIWQYSASAIIGSQHTCDANAYRGTLDQLKALLRGSHVAPTSTPLLGDDMILIRPTGQPRTGAQTQAEADSTVWLWSGGTAVGLVKAQFDVLKSGMAYLDGTMAWADFQSLKSALKPQLDVPAVTVDNTALTAAVSQAVSAVKGTISFG